MCQAGQAKGKNTAAFKGVFRDAPPENLPVDAGELSGVYFFLSLDLVNSTKFKTDKPNDSPTVIRSFYDEAAKVCTASFANFQSSSTQVDVFDGAIPKVWKYIGDEILFFLRLGSEKQATSCVEAAYFALEAIRTAMENATNRAMSVKGTCWSAVVDYMSSPTIGNRSAPIEAPNIMFRTAFGADSPSFAVKR